MYWRVSEFLIEPIGSDESEEDEEYHLDSSWESLRSTDTTDIEVVIDESDTTNTDKSKEGNIRLISIPETVFEAPSECWLCPWSHVLDHDREDYQENNGKENDGSSHSRCSWFSLMQSRELFRFSHECLFPYLFPHLILHEKWYPIGHHEKCHHKWENKRSENKYSIRHTKGC